MNLRTVLRGTGVAIVTPFDDNDSVDFDSLGNMIDFVISNGVEYIVSQGTTGETPTLDSHEKLDILAYTFEKINGRVPVVVGIGGNNTKEVCNTLQKFCINFYRHHFI